MILAIVYAILLVLIASTNIRIDKVWKHIREMEKRDGNH